MRISDFRKPIEKREHPVDLVGGVFPCGYYTIIASKAGVGKTWLMLKLACEMSLGGTVLAGLSTNEKPRKIVIFCGETGSEMLENRLNATEWNFNSDNIVIYSLFECLAGGVNLYLNAQEGQQNIRTIIENEKPDIVFFDTLISFHTVDENSQKDMAFVYSFVARLAKGKNIAVVLMHHLRKGQQGAKKDKTPDQDEIIGTSTTNRLAGVLFTITRQSSINEIFPVNTVTNVKNWNVQIPTFNYKIVTVGNRVDLAYDFSPQIDLTIRQRLTNFFKIMEYDKEYTARDISNLLGIPYAAMRGYMRDFVNSGVIEIVENPEREKRTPSEIVYKKSY